MALPLKLRRLSVGIPVAQIVPTAVVGRRLEVWIYIGSIAFHVAILQPKLPPVVVVALTTWLSIRRAVITWCGIATAIQLTVGFVAHVRCAVQLGLCTGAQRGGGQHDHQEK